MLVDGVCSRCMLYYKTMIMDYFTYHVALYTHYVTYSTHARAIYGSQKLRQAYRVRLMAMTTTPRLWRIRERDMIALDVHDVRCPSATREPKSRRRGRVGTIEDTDWVTSQDDRNAT